MFKFIIKKTILQHKKNIRDMEELMEDMRFHREC